MAQERLGATREQRRDQVRVIDESRVANREDPTVEPMKVALLDPLLDLSIREPARKQLLE